MLLLTRAEAKAAGLADYFTGKACPRGHVAERKTGNGECRECARLYAESKHAARKDDPHYRARNAKRANRNYAQREEPKRQAKRDRAEAARLKHPHLTIQTRKEAIALGSRRYCTGVPCSKGHVVEKLVSDHACPECRKLFTAKWRTRNVDRIRAYNFAYYQADVDGHRLRSRLYNRKRRDEPEYKERNRTRTKVWVAKNPDRHKVNVSRRRARKLLAGGSHTAADLLRIRKQQRDRCGYCRVTLKGKGHLDHIEPLAKGGSNGPSNLQWLCVPCNRRKQANDPIDFAQSIGKLL